MCKNKGFSLVELIVVIAIMAVMTGLVSMGIGAISGLEAKECAMDLDGYLKQAKTSALSKEGQKLTIQKDSTDQNYYVLFAVQKWGKDALGNAVSTEEVTSKELIASDSVTITCHITNGSVYTIGTDAQSVAISFNRSSGAYEDVFVDAAKITGENCDLITITKAGKTYEIEMIPETGKHLIK